MTIENHSQYKAEAKEKWGNTGAYKEFEKKTANHTEADFRNSAEGLDEIFKKFAQCKMQGHTPHSNEAQTLTKELQTYITQNFYTCTDDILKGLGTIYTCDERFKENIDKHLIGTAEFVSSAIEIYCN